MTFLTSYLTLQGDSLEKEVLIIGLTDGTISRQYLYFFKDRFNLNIDGVEIDTEMIKAAKVSLVIFILLPLLKIVSMN